MAPSPVFDRPLGLVSDIDPASEPSSQPEVFFQGMPVEQDLLLAAGKSGLLLAFYLQLLAARDGRSYPLLAVDNHWSEFRSLRHRLPDGRIIGISPRSFLALGAGQPRSELRRFPLLVERYEGPEGLLAGVPVRETAGEGGHAIRAVSALDLDLMPRTVRRRIRSLLLRGRRRLAHQGHGWADLPQQAEATPAEQLRVWVLFSTTGSCGAGTSYLWPFFVLAEAAALQIPVRVYGVAVGPTIFTGVHDHVLENHAATLLDLEDAQQHGIDWPLIDGSSLSLAEPGYRRVFLFDDEEIMERLAERQPDTGSHEPVSEVPEAERRTFFTRVATSLYLLQASSSFQEIESPAANRFGRRLPYGVVRGALADLQRELRQERLVTAIAHSRLAAAGGLPVAVGERR